MTFSEYQKSCLRTWNRDMSPRDRLLNAALSLNEEAGEVAGIIKKAKFHNHEFDLAAIEKELGDVLYYLTVLAYEVASDLDMVASSNIKKLQDRYPDGYSDERSRNRKEED